MKSGFVGQIIAACSKCLIFPIPLKIASTWFPANEISVAASLGVIGYQSGWAFGFLIPPLVITGPIKTFETIPGFNGSYPADWKDSDQWSNNVTEQATVEVRNQILAMFISLACFCTIVFIIMIILVKDGPRLG